MAGKLPGNPSQDTNAREIPSVHMPKEPQCLTRKWYFSRQEIEDHSPSRKDGIQYEEESELRKLYCSFLQELGKKLNVPQLTIATAMMLCHRFYIRQSHAKNDWQTIATVSMFLACKAEETPCWLNDVAVVAYKLMYRWDPSAPRRIIQKDVFDKHKELILIGERLLLSTIAFDLNIEHPYKPLVAALKRLDILNKELAGLAWNFVNDWLRTTLCLQYKPHYIAAGSMFLAAKYAKVKLPTEKGKVWWMQFDVSPKQLEEVIQQMLGLLEKNRKQALPPMRGKVIESKPSVVKAMPNIPQSAIISGSNVAQYMGHGAKVDTGGFDKSATSNSPHSCIMSSSNVAADYSGHGAMMDAGGRVESAISSTPQSCITSCSNVAQDTTVHGATMDAGGRIEPAVSSTPQSCIVSWSNVAQDTGHGATVDAGGLVKSEMSKRNENEASSDFHVCMKESLCCQASDCGSANSVVEDGGGEPKAGESDQNSSTKIVSNQGSDGKININRIREALKKRRWEKTVNKKLGEAMDDEIDSEAWIERELEIGIEVETASVNKRRKF